MPVAQNRTVFQPTISPPRLFADRKIKPAFVNPFWRKLLLALGESWSRGTQAWGQRSACVWAAFLWPFTRAGNLGGLVDTCDVMCTVEADTTRALAYPGKRSWARGGHSGWTGFQQESGEEGRAPCTGVNARTGGWGCEGAAYGF